MDFFNRIRDIIDNLRKSNEEYHQRVLTLQREVYVLTNERDTLRIEKNKADELISRVTTEGEVLSKKQAAQESTISKLRAQIGKFEEEKKELITKLQVEEKNVENIKRGMVATEKLLQETIEKNHSEVHALTSERDTLRIEQNEKDEVISRLTAEGEELSKKQGAKEFTISKLRAQIGEFEEEKKELITKLQAEEKNLESIKKDKDATEKLLRETIEKNLAEVYALTSERDTLRIEQNEKDEVISQLTAEGEELSKKQAAQESTISKLHAQIGEFEEEKKELITKLQVKEKNIESIKSEKAATEKLLQETIEKNHVEVYALTREIDTLRIEQNEKDEVISRLTAQGEELSNKQGAQESTNSKLREQIREFEEEKKELITKLQVEEKIVEGIKKDKAALENLLQETIEKNHAEVYALTSERDTLLIEQNEKDEFISRLKAEGEELSNKQVAQESTISKLRTQIEEFKEEKKELITKLQKNVESIKRDKAATDKLLQETIEKNHAEVYALTTERDKLRIKQNEKDEVISRLTAEGEELSKKQAAQQSTISKLLTQIGEFKEEKQKLITKLQVEENNIASIKRNTAATEKLLQETIEKNLVEVATQKELERRIKESEEREAMLDQTLEELRQTLSRKEEQLEKILKRSYFIRIIKKIF